MHPQREPTGLLQRAHDRIPCQPLAALLFALLAVNAAAWPAALAIARLQPGALILTGLAWALGAFHGFEVYHVAPIDSVRRKLRHKGKRSLATGLLVAPGHSSIVIALCAAIAFGARGFVSHFGAQSVFGSTFGTGISAACLTFIGLTNLLLFPQLLRAYHWAVDDARWRLRLHTIITATVTGLATMIGSVEWTEILAMHAWLDRFDFGVLGFAAVVAMAAVWGVAAAVERLPPAPALSAQRLH